MLSQRVKIQNDVCITYMKIHVYIPETRKIIELYIYIHTHTKEIKYIQEDTQLKWQLFASGEGVWGQE